LLFEIQWKKVNKIEFLNYKSRLRKGRWEFSKRNNSLKLITLKYLFRSTIKTKLLGGLDPSFWKVTLSKFESRRQSHFFLSLPFQVTMKDDHLSQEEEESVEHLNSQKMEKQSFTLSLESKSKHFYSEEHFYVLLVISPCYSRC
jgi:hypothetical protein